MMHEIKRHPAEELLIQESVRLVRSKQLRTVLGCVGCKWLNAEQNGEPIRFYAREIWRCSSTINSGENRVMPGVLSPMLHRFVEAGIMKAEQDNTKSTTGPPRTYYYQADTELGQVFWESLQMPLRCGLRESDKTV